MAKLLVLPRLQYQLLMALINNPDDNIVVVSQDMIDQLAYEFDLDQPGAMSYLNSAVGDYEMEDGDYVRVEPLKDEQWDHPVINIMRTEYNLDSNEEELPF